MIKKKLITVVTDHQLMADTIARAIGANEKHDGYYLGKGYAVTWTNGNVIEATFKPEESFVLSTEMDCRLVFAHNFELAMRNYDELVGYKKSEEDQRQLSIIMALWKMSHTVINAMAPSFEGDLSFLSLYYYIKMPVSVRRAWLPMLTKGAIVNAIVNEKNDVERYEKWLSDSIYNHLVDLTKADVVKEGNNIVLELSHERTTQIMEKMTGNNVIPPAGFEGEAQDQNFILRVTPTPELYNISGLLLDGATELDFTHEEVLQAALTLYAKKLISYPLTFQNTIPYEVWKQMKKNKQVLIYNNKWGKKVKGGKFLTRRHNFRNGESEFNGHGIVTTGLHPIDLTHKEEKLYNMIVKRVLDAFTPAKSKRNSKPKKDKTS